MSETESPTPGPWVAIKAGSCDAHQFEVLGQEPDDHEFTNENHEGHVLAQVLFTARDDNHFRSGEANARLIAAAPDLLSACQAMLAALDTLGPGGECNLDVYAAEDLTESAITKATGKPA